MAQLIRALAEPARWSELDPVVVHKKWIVMACAYNPGAEKGQRKEEQWSLLATSLAAESVGILDHGNREEHDGTYPGLLLLVGYIAHTPPSSQIPRHIHAPR